MAEDCVGEMMIELCEDHQNFHIRVLIMPSQTFDNEFQDIWRKNYSLYGYAPTLLGCKFHLDMVC